MVFVHRSRPRFYVYSAVVPFAYSDVTLYYVPILISCVFSIYPLHKGLLQHSPFECIQIRVILVSPLSPFKTINVIKQSHYPPRIRTVEVVANTIFNDTHADRLGTFRVHRGNRPSTENQFVGRRDAIAGIAARRRHVAAGLTSV